MVTALCLAATLVIALSAQVFPSFLTRLGGSELQQGLLLFSMFLLYPFSSVLAGTVSDRAGKRPVLAAGLLLLALAFALSAVFPDLRIRTLAVLLFGLAIGAVESQAAALLSDLNPSRERSVMNLAQIMFSAGAAGGPFLLVLLFSLPTGATLPAVLWTCAGLGLLLALGFASASAPRAGARPSAWPKPAAWPEPAGGSRAGPGPQAPGGRPRARVWRHPVMGLLAASLFLYVAAEMGTSAWLAKYGEVHLGLRQALAPICLTLFWGGQSVSRTLVGLLSSRVSDAAVLYGSLLLSLAGQVLAFSVLHPAAALVGMGLAGLGMGPFWPTLVAMAGRLYRETSGTAIGILVASGGVAVALIQLAVGWLSKPALLGLRWSLLGLAVFTAANLLLAHRIRHLRP